MKFTVGSRIVLAFLIALFLVVLGAMPGCSGDGGSGPLAPAPAHGAGNSGGSAATATAIVVGNVHFIVPDWLDPADYAAFEAGALEYLQDASAALSGYAPGPGDSATFPLTVVVDDVVGKNWWQYQTRTAWICWPRAADGKPVSVAFMPLFHAVMVMDRRVAQGVSVSAPWTQEELDAWHRGAALPVKLQTKFPSQYD